MGILGAIGNFVFNNDYDESYSQGENWADRVYGNGDTLTPEEAANLGQEYSSDPQAFYNGYRDTWNESARIWNMHVAYERGEDPPEEPRHKLFGIF
jgi:hypothetical protein